MKNVSASATSFCAAASSAVPRHGAAAGGVGAVDQSRCWMYCGQLPKLWSTRTDNVPAADGSSVPLARLRRRVGSSMPSRPMSAPATSTSASGSPATGRTAQYRRPWLTVGVDRSGQNERQLLEKLAVLAGHQAAHAAPALEFHLVDHADAPLGFQLAGMEQGLVFRPGGRRYDIGHDGTPSCRLMIRRQYSDVAEASACAGCYKAAFNLGSGTKRGSCSMRRNQARRCGYGSSDTSPSGAMAM